MQYVANYDLKLIYNALYTVICDNSDNIVWEINLVGGCMVYEA